MCRRKKSEHGASHTCARRFESESVERDKSCLVKLRSEVFPRKDERDGKAPHPTPREHGHLTVGENLFVTPRVDSPVAEIIPLLWPLERSRPSFAKMTAQPRH